MLDVKEHAKIQKKSNSQKCVDRNSCQIGHLSHRGFLGKGFYKRTRQGTFAMECQRGSLGRNKKVMRR